MKRTVLFLVVVSAFVCINPLWADEGDQVEKPEESRVENDITPEMWELLSNARDRRVRVDLESDGKAAATIKKALDSPINLELDENVTFEELFTMIRDQIPGINIVLDLRCEVTPSTAVTDEPVRYQGIKLRNVLRLLLREHDMTYLIRNEVLFLTSEEKAKTICSIKVGMWNHDIMPLDSKIDPNVFDNVANQNDLTEIMDLIESVVNPETWGESGTSVEYYPNLCVTPRIYGEGEEEPSITSEPPTAVLVADPTRLMNDTSPNTSGWGSGWRTTYDKTADYSEIMELTETPEPRKYRIKKRCRLFRR